MKKVLSIQSHVVLGHVGNRAAVFPLERLGVEVLPLNTVQFSNHPGYGSWRGTVYPASQVREIWEGLSALPGREPLDALLSGYLGTPETGEAVLEIAHALREENKELLYCCDPVIGDYQEGIYVKPGVLEFFRDKALPAADIIKPNQFEAEILTGLGIDSLDTARKACDALHRKGPAAVLMTSADGVAESPGSISCLLSLGGKGFRISTPRFSFQTAPHGAGDLICALFLGNLIAFGGLSRSSLGTTSGEGAALSAFSRAIHAVHEVFRLTKKEDTRELAILGAQEAFVHPEEPFPLERLW